MSAREILLAHVQGARAALAASPNLEHVLDSKLAEAHGAWPAVVLADEVFVRHLAEKLAHEDDPLSALENTYAADLYLACACAAGNPQALIEFETHFMSGVAKYLHSQALRSSADEIKQTLRVRLLMGEGDSAPRIVQYTGQGPLGGWLRAASVRTGLRDLRDEDIRMRRQSSSTTNPFASPPPPEGRSPELRYLQSYYRAEFEAVLKDILGRLSARERNFLAMHYLDGVSPEALESLYDVSGRTLRRWLGRINKKILADTLRRLRERFDLSTADLGPLMAMVQSQLNMSLSRILRASGVIPPD